MNAIPVFCEKCNKPIGKVAVGANQSLDETTKLIETVQNQHQCKSEGKT